MTTESLLNIGIIGTGAVCAYGHFPAMEQAKGARLLALCDVNAEAQLPQLTFFCGDGEICEAEAADLGSEGVSEAYIRADQHFVDCILNNRRPEPSGECGLTASRVIDAVYESSRTGKEVAF